MSRSEEGENDGESKPTSSRPLHEFLTENGESLLLNKPMPTEAWSTLKEALTNNNKLTKIYVGERFFGLGVTASKPSKKEMQELIQDFCQANLQELCIRGLLHNSMNLMTSLPSQLQVLRLHSGITIDHSWDVKGFAKSIQNHSSLQEISIRNFVVQCQDLKTISPIMDPLIQAAATIATLQRLELVCMAAHRPHQDQPLIATQVLEDFLACFKNRPLRSLAFTKMGLWDAHLRILSDALMEDSLFASTLSHLSWNENVFSETAILDCILPLIACNRNLRVLHVHNRSRLSEDTCQALLDCVQAPNQPLYTLEVNFPWNLRGILDYSLAMNKLGGPQAIHDPTWTDPMVIERLASVRTNQSALYTLLRAHPKVCSHVQYLGPSVPPVPPAPPSLFRTPEMIMTKRRHKSTTPASFPRRAPRKAMARRLPVSAPLTTQSPQVGDSPSGVDEISQEQALDSAKSASRSSVERRLLAQRPSAELLIHPEGSNTVERPEAVVGKGPLRPEHARRRRRLRRNRKSETSDTSEDESSLSDNVAEERVQQRKLRRAQKSKSLGHVSPKTRAHLRSLGQMSPKTRARLRSLKRLSIG